MLKIKFVKGAKFTAWQNNPLLLVIHWAATTYQGTIWTFQNKKATGSSHYIVGAKGQLCQMVKEKYISWHAGNSQLYWPEKKAYYPTTSQNNVEWQSLNPCSIGIECAGPPSILRLPGWPEPEIKALIELCKDIKNRYPNIKLTDHSTIIIPKGWKVDVKAGTGIAIDIFPWKRLLNETDIPEA